jgi:hypothetical protein
MSKHISKLYAQIDAKVKASPKDAAPTTGLVGKRGNNTEDGMDPVVDYVKYIREMREGQHASK